MEITTEQLKKEYERVLPLISEYLPVFLEMNKREVVSSILTSSDAKRVMEYKSIYTYLDGLQVDLGNNKKDFE